MSPSEQIDRSVVEGPSRKRNGTSTALNRTPLGTAIGDRVTDSVLEFLQNTSRLKGTPPEPALEESSVVQSSYTLFERGLVGDGKPWRSVKEIPQRVRNLLHGPMQLALLKAGSITEYRASFEGELQKQNLIRLEQVLSALDQIISSGENVADRITETIDNLINIYGSVQTADEHQVVVAGEYITRALYNRVLLFTVVEALLNQADIRNKITTNRVLVPRIDVEKVFQEDAKKDPFLAIAQGVKQHLAHKKQWPDPRQEPQVLTEFRDQFDPTVLEKGLGEILARFGVEGKEVG